MSLCEPTAAVLPARGEKSDYVCTPHLMLYILHEPVTTADELPRIRRLLLTSANLSAACAPWHENLHRSPSS